METRSANSQQAHGSANGLAGISSALDEQERQASQASLTSGSRFTMLFASPHARQISGTKSFPEKRSVHVT